MGLSVTSRVGVREGRGWSVERDGPGGSGVPLGEEPGVGAPGGQRDIVDRFLDRMVAHDWDGMAACVADDVERVGPFGDVYRGKADYVAFIANLLPSLAGYAMKVGRIVEAGRVAMVELTETVDGVDTPEALVFDLDDHGLIARVGIYIQSAGLEPEGWR
jgi:SnoaL-like protein